MSDAIKSNLEPIEESDLNLEKKFGGKEEDFKKTAQEVVPLPEIKPEKAERKEGAAEKESAYSKILSKVISAKKPQDEEVASDAEKANIGIDAESKIANLIEIAEVKGVPHAVKVARHIEDNYILDEFHDRLLGDELHDALIKKGLIKEI